MAAFLTPATAPFDEARVLADFERERLSPSRWSNGPRDAYATHDHSYHKVLYCLRGSITFHIEDTGESVELHPGDRLDIEPRTPHSAVVGPAGVTCVEAPRS